MKITKLRTRPATILTAAATGLLLLSAVPAAMAKSDDGGDAKVTVGTYEPQKAFESYVRKTNAQENMSKLQQQMQQAQQKGDRQAAMQVQQQMQAEQQRIVGAFDTAVKDVMPGVAEDAEVDMVAVEVSYTSDEVETRDVTDALIAALEDADEGGEEDSDGDDE